MLMKGYMKQEENHETSLSIFKCTEGGSRFAHPQITSTRAFYNLIHAEAVAYLKALLPGIISLVSFCTHKVLPLFSGEFKGKNYGLFAVPYTF